MLFLLSLGPVWYEECNFSLNMEAGQHVYCYLSSSSLQARSAPGIVCRAKQPTSAHELNSGNGAGGRRPRRAAAAAAAAVIQQEAADVLGLTPILPNAIPEPPPPLSSSPTAAAAALGDKQVNGQSLQPSPHRSSSDAGDQQSYSSGSDTANPAYAASIEGIPQPLLQQIDQLVLENFYWLLAMMTTNPVLTYEFISMDLEEGSKPLPPQEHKMWQDVVNYVQPTLDQLQECSTCIQVCVCNLLVLVWA